MDTSLLHETQVSQESRRSVRDLLPIGNMVVLRNKLRSSPAAGPLQHLLLVVVAALTTPYVMVQAVALVDCDSNRPGWPDHRTLYVPEWMFTTNNNPDGNDNDGEDEENQAWIEALCCVYTHVQVIQSSSSKTVRFEVYDGSSYTIRPQHRSSSTLFANVAAQAMDDICNMQMGSQDCQQRSECIDTAFVAARTPTAETTTMTPTTPIEALNSSTVNTASPQSTTILVVDSTVNDTNENKNTTTLLSNIAKNNDTIVVDLMDVSPSIRDKLKQQTMNCTTDRPGSWPDHRTLYVPSERLFPWHTNDNDNANANKTITMADLTDITNTSVAWIQSLCCVYTYVELVEGALTSSQEETAQLELYDGYTYAIPGDSLIEIAAYAMDDICGMSMGSEDCSEQSKCVDEAFFLAAEGSN